MEGCKQEPEPSKWQEDTAGRQDREEQPFFSSSVGSIYRVKLQSLSLASVLSPARRNLDDCGACIQISAGCLRNCKLEMKL